MKRVLAVLLILVFMFSACGGDTNQKSTGGDTSASQAPETKVEIAGVSLENPILVDKEAGTVTVLAQVNGKYFDQPTRHCSVFKDGSNGAKSIFTAYADHESFYNALMELGGEPGNNMTADNAETTIVEGTDVEMKITWEGAEKEYDVNEVVVDSNGKPITFKFGGNLETAKKKNTGCLSCLDSCPVGIISNSAYTYGAVEKFKEVGFTGNSEVLPEDGTYVATIYKIQK